MTSPGSDPAPPRAPSTTLVGILEIRPALLDDILDAAKRLFGDDRLVYLTDEADFAPLRRRGVLFEYLPSPSVQARLGLPWRAYLGERWPLLLDRWTPHRVVSFGTGIEAFINAAPPGFEDDEPAGGLRTRSRLLSWRIGGQDLGG